MSGKLATDTSERWTVRVTERDIERAVLHALLVVNDHHDGCAQPGSDCPVGTELKAVAKSAAPHVLHRLLDIE